MTRHTRTRPAGGFTIVELLIVVAIIAMLAGILLPALGKARDLARARATGVRVQTLAQACESFKQDHGAYPGLNRWPMNGNPNYSVVMTLEDRTGLSGSQVLAMCLLDYYVPKPDEPLEPWMPMSEYLANTPNPNDDRPTNTYIGSMDNVSDDDRILTGRWHTILDTWPTKSNPKAMPILYFPARPGQAGVANIYKTTDNLGKGGTYPLDDDRTRGAFHAMISRSVPEENWSGDYADSRTQPYRPDSFILIAPGPDREWFTGDDITNFTE